MAPGSNEVDASPLERRIADWTRSEQAARDAEKIAAHTLEGGDDKPLAQNAAQLRGIAEAGLQSILQGIRTNRMSPFR